MAKNKDIIIRFKLDKEISSLSAMTQALIEESIKIEKKLKKKKIYVNNVLILNTMQQLEMDSIQNKIKEKLKKG